MGGNRQIVLVRRPEGMVDESCFDEVDGDIRSPGRDEILVRTLYLTIDPAIRGWLNEKGSGYLPGVGIGEPIRGAGVGEIVESNAEGYPVGGLVTCMTGWQEYALGTSDMSRMFEFATLLPTDVDPVAAATVLSNPGWTAYAGVTRVLAPTGDDHVLVTAASSLVGSIAGQLAKRRGSQVVGTAGSPAKCDWVVDELGFDACIDYRAENLDQRLKALFPHGIDAVFDNVGGATLDTVLRRMATHGRILLCGSVGRDNATEPYRLANYDRLMSRRVTMSGFNFVDHLDVIGEATAVLRAGLDDGSIRYRTKSLHGLENAPAGLVGLYNDPTPGKTVIIL